MTADERHEVASVVGMWAVGLGLASAAAASMLVSAGLLFAQMYGMAMAEFEGGESSYDLVYVAGYFVVAAGLLAVGAAGVMGGQGLPVVGWCVGLGCAALVAPLLLALAFVELDFGTAAYFASIAIWTALAGTGYAALGLSEADSLAT